MTDKSNPLNLIISNEGGQGRDVMDAVIADPTRDLRTFCLSTPTDFGMGRVLPLENLTVNPNEDWFVGVRRDRQVMALLAGQLEHVQLARVIHPRAWVSPWATLGQNTFVGAMAVINPQVRLGNFVFVNAGCVLDHDCQIGDGTSLGPGVTFPGYVSVGANCAIGAGVVARPGITIADDCTLGAGAVVVSDLQAPGVYIGNPARLLTRSDDS
ncbi:MAG: acetyltransferase [Pseudomonadota bacterium]